MARLVFADRDARVYAVPGAELPALEIDRLGALIAAELGVSLEEAPSPVPTV